MPQRQSMIACGRPIASRASEIQTAGSCFSSGRFPAHFPKRTSGCGVVATDADGASATPITKPAMASPIFIRFSFIVCS